MKILSFTKLSKSKQIKEVDGIYTSYITTVLFSSSQKTSYTIYKEHLYIKRVYVDGYRSGGRVYRDLVIYDTQTRFWIKFKNGKKNYFSSLKQLFSSMKHLL